MSKRFLSICYFQIAVILKNLMLRLGFNKFYLQGGDWGAVIVTQLSSLFPDKYVLLMIICLIIQWDLTYVKAQKLRNFFFRVIGVHSNMCIIMSASSTIWRIIGSFFPFLVVDSKYADRMYPLGYHTSRLIEESGYMHIQSSKPDSIGTWLYSFS